MNGTLLLNTFSHARLLFVKLFTGCVQVNTATTAFVLLIAQAAVEQLLKQSHSIV
jgi:hypothetical protein